MSANNYIYIKKLIELKKAHSDIDVMDIVSLLDILDLDEEVIDARLRSIMVRDAHTNKQLASAIQLLQYKYLINKQENTECENNEEYAFIAKLINEIHSGNVQNICKIINVALSLNTITLVSKSEHLLQQILSNIDLSLENLNVENSAEKVLLNFQVCDSILDTALGHNEKICLPFLEMRVDNILLCSNERLKVHFLTNTVPKLFHCVLGFSVLDAIWSHLRKSHDDQKESALKILSSLSDYYLPVANYEGDILFESEIIVQPELWNIILFGLMSSDPTVRKIAIYVTKRTLDCIITVKKDILIKSEDVVLFKWVHKRQSELKNMWDNYFILLESLEEKQSNIVLPSLQLFQIMNDIESHWLNCAFNIGLKHDNIQVRTKCIQYRLESKFNSQPEVTILLEALNDINIYEKPAECETLKKKIADLYDDVKVFIFVYKCIPLVKWSPVPLYHISNVLSLMPSDKMPNISQEIMSAMKKAELVQLVKDLLMIPCNILPLRKAIHRNFSQFIYLSCRRLHWKQYINIFPLFQINFFENNFIIKLVLQHVMLNIDNKHLFLEVIMTAINNIEFMLFYLENQPDDFLIFDVAISNKFLKIKDIASREYSRKKECINDVIFITHLYNKTIDNRLTISMRIKRDLHIVLWYFKSLLSSEEIFPIDELNPLLNDFLVSVTCGTNKELILELYTNSCLLLKDMKLPADKAVLSMHIVNSLHRNTSFISQYKHEMLNLDEVLKLTTGFENKKKIGRLTNALYENLCELVHSLVKSESEHICKCINDITDFIDTVLECGGYGCLIWVLRIMNLILPSIMKNEETFDLVSFIHRSWKEIEELKSNSQYYPCIEEFVALILQDTLLQRPIYNNIVILYCSKMIESGPTKNTPFFYLVKELNTKEISESYGQLVCVLSEILLYSPVPRKDQRIVENLIAEISQESKFDLSQSYDTGANLQIQYFAVSCLCKIAQSEVHTAITSFITKKIDEIFKNKQRYHGGSQPHRTLLIALQHLLSILLRTEGCDTEVVKNWCIELLGKLPHQPNVRVCLEWYIALCLYIQKTKLNDELLQQFTTKNVPLISQLVILHWVLKRKLLKDTCENNEYNYVMDLLLSHTMGQVFNIRLHSQYLSTLLHKTNECNSEKYAYTIGIIEKTFADNNNDKNYMKLKQDYFINEFDIVTDLTPAFIYYFLPKYTDILNECINMKDVKDIMKSIGETVAETDGKFHDEWRSCRRSDNDIFDYSFNKNIESKVDEIEDVVGTIQKKYVPWKNMSDVHIYDCNKKKVERPRDLIVVASLIDKLPNLGGMARTSEVFGVKTYVVDSLRHLEDKQFQSLSVSAEKWIDVEEVRPGLALKQYLMNRKAEGYSVVAAEQTSNSCPLQSFKFPKKTLLLLGHEKEGVPCDLLPLMDHCVEIPQQGVVRSLNVHVTAAIFIWEYARQNIL